MLAGEGVRDAEGRLERARHRAQSRATAQQQRSVNVEQNQSWFHAGCLP
jgi:hypothetical protein